MTTVKEIPAKLVAELRARTGAGMMDCKSALQECGGDLDKAVDILRKKGAAKAEKSAGREASGGGIGSYARAEIREGRQADRRRSGEGAVRQDRREGRGAAVRALRARRQLSEPEARLQACASQIVRRGVRGWASFRY